MVRQGGRAENHCDDLYSLCQQVDYYFTATQGDIFTMSFFVGSVFSDFSFSGEHLTTVHFVDRAARQLLSTAPITVMTGIWTTTP